MIHHRLRGLQKGAQENYATINPNDKDSAIILSDNNLTVETTQNNAWRSARATISKSSGKWYFEFNSGVSTDYRQVGFATADMPLTTYLGMAGADGSSTGWSMVNTGDLATDAVGDGFSTGTPHSPNPGTNTWFGLAVDMDNGKIWLSQADGAFYNSGDPSSGTFPTWEFSGLTIYPACSMHSTDASLTFNFGATAFVYSVPNGFNSGWYE